MRLLYHLSVLLCLLRGYALKHHPPIAHGRIQNIDECIIYQYYRKCEETVVCLRATVEALICTNPNLSDATRSKLIATVTSAQTCPRRYVGAVDNFHQTNTATYNANASIAALAQW